MSLIRKNSKTNTAASEPFVTAVIVAAGNSTRMDGVNKQFLLIDGVPVLVRTLWAFSDCELINEIIVAARQEDIPRMYAMLRDYEILKVSDIVNGGATRQQSVLNAVKRSSPSSEFLAIHDGARPLVTKSIIENTVRAAFETGAAATGVRVKDTVKIVNSQNIITSTPDRNFLWAVHTPQVFDRKMYLSALDSVPDCSQFTDDCKLMEEYGAEVTMVEGSYENIKITTPEDIDIAEAFIYRREAND